MSLATRRYPDVGFALDALYAAKRAGVLRQFRVKYPGSCACCGRPFRVGTPVLAPEHGTLVGRCCALNPELWGW